MMEWKDINALLSSTRASLSGRIRRRTTVIQTLSEILKVPLSGDDVIIQGGVVRVSGHPAIKNEILLKKEQILSLLRTRCGSAIKDIF